MLYCEARELRGFTSKPPYERGEAIPHSSFPSLIKGFEMVVLVVGIGYTALIVALGYWLNYRRSE